MTYDQLCALTYRDEDLMALQREKRARAILLDKNMLMTAEMRRRLKSASDRILQALTTYEEYIANALKSYDSYRLVPESIEITLRIQGDKDHRHLAYPDWYHDSNHKMSRKDRELIMQLEKEMEAEPRWVDVNDMLYDERYRIVNDDWLQMTWRNNERVTDVIAHRCKRMAELRKEDADGICLALYRLKDVYCLALEDVLDITDYKVDLHARIINY